MFVKTMPFITFHFFLLQKSIKVRTCSGLGLRATPQAQARYWCCYAVQWSVLDAPAAAVQRSHGYSPSG